MKLLKFPSDVKLREKYFAPAEKGHPARANLYMMIWLIKKLTKPGDTILDPCSGVGSLMYATLLGRNVVNIELEKHFMDVQSLNWAFLNQHHSTTGELYLMDGDARRYLPTAGIDHCIFSPPYCLAPDTKILKTDLTWVPLSTIEVGDELIGVDEFSGGTGSGIGRKLRRSVVEATTKTITPAYLIKLSNAEEVICSGNHKWLQIPSGGGRYTPWVETDQLEYEQQLKYLGKPWTIGQDYEHGYLAGVYDGEAWVRGSHGGLRSKGFVGFRQNDGVVKEKVANLLADLGYHPSSLGDPKVINLSGCYETMKFLGSVRPLRLMEQSYLTWEGHTLKSHFTGEWNIEVISITPLGNMELIDLQTSTRTFIANGLVSHNSVNIGGAGAKVAALAAESKTSVAGYGKDRAQLCTLSYFNLLLGMKEIYRGIYNSLPVGGYMCTITKDSVNTKEAKYRGLGGIEPYSADTIKVCYEVGFELYQLRQRDAKPSLRLQIAWSQNPYIPHVVTEEIIIMRRPK